MNNKVIRRLNNQQLQQFDREYVGNLEWKTLKSLIEHNFNGQTFSFLDIGGGNGIFTDRILKNYPESVGTVIDNASILLELNKPDIRKTLLLASVEELNNICAENTKFDLIFFNWSLHHFVQDSYHETRKIQYEALINACNLLSENGYISIFENIYDGIVFTKLPSYLIFYLTSSKILASTMKKMGANTAGCGVCFLSKAQWEDTITKAGLIVSQYTDYEKWKNINILRRIFLHIGPVRHGHFWLSKKQNC
ncbi:MULTISPECIES: trans-aconitate 2-methyltransferase [unclassified Nostoc]|uniref:class I SAM-dependent methyltransferase n=1 Tax=unclassified Nostoc TaxID=2593658 RepID=UPI001D3C8EBD|nr:class I SAM-dependent methyltransferase [Nostoc sp. JL23]MBN3879170.1 methyltransferase domain-containing protein [Nostoc sp. JL23]